ERNPEYIRERDSQVDFSVPRSRDRLESMPTDTRGPWRCCLLGSLLARLGARRIGLGRPDGPALARRHGRVRTGTRGPWRLGLLGSLLARLGARRIGLARPNWYWWRPSHQLQLQQRP